MAIMYPKDIADVKASFAEKKVYEALSKLSNSFVIFHSVQWVKRNLSKSFTWYENDFLLLHKKHGIIVLEVKGGRIYFQDGIFHQVNLDTGDDCALDEGNDPLSQAKKGIYHFRNLLERRIRGISQRLSIEPAVWLPAVDTSLCKDFPILYEEARPAILDCNSLLSPANAINNILNFYHSDNRTDISDEEFEQIRDAIAPDFDLIPSPSIIKSELDSLFLKLTNEQSGLLDYLVEQRTATIQGAAGTGKTLVALEAARRFSSDGKRVLFLCFNRLLFEHLKLDCPIENVDFYNINSFVGKYTSCNIIDIKIRVDELLLMILIMMQLSLMKHKILKARKYSFYLMFARLKISRFIHFMIKISY